MENSTTNPLSALSETLATPGQNTTGNGTSTGAGSPAASTTAKGNQGGPPPAVAALIVICLILMIALLGYSLFQRIRRRRAPLLPSSSPNHGIDFNLAGKRDNYSASPEGYSEYGSSATLVPSLFGISPSSTINPYILPQPGQAVIVELPRRNTTMAAGSVNDSRLAPPLSKREMIRLQQPRPRRGITTPFGNVFSPGSAPPVYRELE